MPPLVNVDPLNVDADGAPDPMRLLALGIRGVRLVIRDNSQVRQYAQTVQNSGLVVLGVVTEESHGYLMADQPADIYQIGNEPDFGGLTDYTPGSDSMGPVAYAAYWNLYWDTWFASGKPLNGVPVIGAGLASGHTAYWSQVQQAGGLHGASGFAIHPYGRIASSAAVLIRSYQSITPGLPVWVTEWNRPPNEISTYAAMLRQAQGVVGHAFFCWHRFNNMEITEPGARLLGAFS